MRVTGRRPEDSPAPRPTWPVNLPGTVPTGAGTEEGKPEQEGPALAQGGTPVAVADGVAKNDMHCREGSRSF